MRYCKVCNREIPAERLEALPNTHTCTEHSGVQRTYGFMIPTASKGCAAELMIVPPGEENERLARNAHRRKR